MVNEDYLLKTNTFGDNSRVYTSRQKVHKSINHFDNFKYLALFQISDGLLLLKSDLAHHRGPDLAQTYIYFAIRTGIFTNWIKECKTNPFYYIVVCDADENGKFLPPQISVKHNGPASTFSPSNGLLIPFSPLESLAIRETPNGFLLDCQLGLLVDKECRPVNCTLETINCKNFDDVFFKKTVRPYDDNITVLKFSELDDVKIQSMELWRMSHKKDGITYKAKLV